MCPKLTTMQFRNWPARLLIRLRPRERILRCLRCWRLLREVIMLVDRQSFSQAIRQERYESIFSRDQHINMSDSGWQYRPMGGNTPISRTSVASLAFFPVVSSHFLSAALMVVGILSSNRFHHNLSDCVPLPAWRLV